MYQVLDDFLNEASWDSGHWADKERFFVALEKMVNKENFDAERVGDYIADKHFNQHHTPLDDDRRKYYICASQAVFDYLKAIRGQFGSVN